MKKLICTLLKKLGHKNEKLKNQFGTCSRDLVIRFLRFYEVLDFLVLVLVPQCGDSPSSAFASRDVTSYPDILDIDFFSRRPAKKYR